MWWIWVPKTRVGRALVAVFLTVLLLLVLAPLAAMQVPAVRRQVHRWVEFRLTRSLGREVRLEGVAFRPWSGYLDLAEVRVGAGQTSQAGTLVAADSIQLRWNWQALLRRSIEIDRIVLVRPRLTILPSVALVPDSRTLLPTLLELRAVTLDGWTVAMREVEIKEGRVSWGANGAGGRVEGLSGTVRWPEDLAGEPKITVSLRATRIPASLGGGVRELQQVSLQGELTARDFTVTAAEAQAAGARLTASGRILDPGDAAHTDLHLGLAAPLDALLSTVKTPKKVDGVLEAEGRLTGPWRRPAFRGKGILRLTKTAQAHDPVPFAVQWEKDRLEIETAGVERSDSISARLLLEPATGSYRARFAAREADLGGLADLPILLAYLAGLTLPPDLRGRLTADLDLSGRGTDLTTLRGYGTVRVDDLALKGDLPSGRLEARVVASSTRLTLETFALKIPGATLQGRGTVSFLDGSVDLPIRADLQDVGAFARGFGFPMLGGKATFQGHLTGTREAPRLRGRLAWRDPRIALQALDQIEGDVEVTPRTLRTPRLTLRVGSTTATVRGSVAARGTVPFRTLDPKRDLVLDLQGQVGPGRTADIAGFFPDNLDLRAVFQASGRIAGTPGALTGEVDLALTSPETWGERWQRGDAKVRLLPDGIEITRFLLQRGPEQVTGEIRIGKDGNLKGRLTGVALDLAKLSFLAGSRIVGRANAQADLQGTSGDPRVAGRATSDALLYRDVPLGPAAGTFSVTKQGTDLDMSVREESYRLRMKLGPPPDRNLMFDLALVDADLDTLLRLAEVEALRAWHPRGTGRILLRGAGGDLAAATGEANLSALHLRQGEQVWDNRGPVEFTWRGKTVTLRQARLRSGEQDVEFRGSLGEADQTDLQVKGQLPLPAFQGRIPVIQPLGGVATVDLRARGPLSAPDLEGKLDIAGGHLALRGIPAPIEDARSTVEFQRGHAFLRTIQGRIGGGSLRGSGEASRDKEQWSFRVTFQEENGRAEQILAGLYTGKGEVTGALSLGGTLASRGRGEEGFWPNLEGELKLAMRDGRMGRQAFTTRILSIINIGQLFDTPGLDVAAQGLPYQRLTADIKIEQGVARTENLLFESRAFNLSAVGEVNLVEDTIEMDLAVKPFQNVDRFLSKVPVAGWLLGGKEKNLVATFYRVTGSLKDPQVTSLPAKSLGRNVLGVFRHLLDIPEAIIGP